MPLLRAEVPNPGHTKQPDVMLKIMKVTTLERRCEENTVCSFSDLSITVLGRVRATLVLQNGGGV